MDMFKLLTRGTKLPKSSKSNSTQPSVIPSAGQNAAPLLFGSHQVLKQDKVLGKRKRKGQLAANAHIANDLDFFNSQSAGQRSTEAESDSESRDSAVEETKSALPSDAYPAGNDLDLGQCKQLLRSHRIKISVLHSSGTQLAPGKRQKKHKKQQREKEKRHRLDQVSIRPVTSFSALARQCGLHGGIFDNLRSLAYTVPTEVQMAALPLLMQADLIIGQDREEREIQSPAGLDLLAVAPTGSGKTLAFLIPILNSLLKRRLTDQKSDEKGPSALIIGPTRELAAQIVNEARKLALNTGIKVSLVKKGILAGVDSGLEWGSVEHEDNQDGLEASEASDEDAPVRQTTVVKSDILVSTPLALVNALHREGGAHAILPSIKHLVLDEADVLLDPLFREQTMVAWNSCTNPDLRTSMWSATMASSIEELASASIKARKEQATILRLVVGFKDAAIHTLSHKLVYAASEQGKLLALRQLLHPTAPSSSTGRGRNEGEHMKELRPPFLIFTQTIPRASALHSELMYDIPPEAGGSSRIAVLHSALSESARSNVMTKFRQGEIWIIITTDLLARGVDFKGLNGVVNYDVPTSAAAYVHRAGRTGRAGRQGGIVITMYTKEDVSHIKPIVNVIKQAEKARTSENGEKPSDDLPSWLLDSLPSPSKRDKKQLKRRGIEARRSGTKAALISTKVKRRGGWINPGSFDGQKAAIETQQRSLSETEFNGFHD
jgi:ATP-dependent RNA helicase DDX52/ROK1